jgi:UDP-2,4-diacetamido-2,4,6-trideoxy-beta-L-altropyranose hydrolase
MQIIFRVNSGPLIGVGHLSRCLALASELARRGADIHFVSSSNAGNSNDLIRQGGFCCHELVDTRGECFAMDHTIWKKSAIDEEFCALTSTVAALGRVDWMVVDSYGVDERLETRLRVITRRIAVLDDLANRSHDADILIDQNLFNSEKQRYIGLLPKHCVSLLGPKYALLRSEFWSKRSEVDRSVVNRERMRILAFFGGGDATGETIKFLRGWKASVDGALSADVVVGANNPKIVEVTRLADELKNVRVHYRTNSMAELMAGCDYAFGASGSSNWERLCLGLEASVVSLANNQIETAQALHELQLANYIGRSEETNAETYASLLKNLMRGSVFARSGAERLMSFVDGLGAKRVAETMCDISECG